MKVMNLNVDANKVIKGIGVTVAGVFAVIEAIDKQKQADAIKDLLKRVAELEAK